jgi:hypothetical protein
VCLDVAGRPPILISQRSDLEESQPITPDALTEVPRLSVTAEAGEIAFFGV